MASVYKRLREAHKLLLTETKRHFGAMTFDKQTKSLISEDGKDRIKLYSKDEVSLDGRTIQSSIGSVVIESVPVAYLKEETIRIESP